MADRKIGLFFGSDTGNTETVAEKIIEILDRDIDLIKYDYLDKKYSEDEIVEHSQDADYIFVFWCKYQHKYAGENYPHDLLDKINKVNVVKLIG